MKKSLTKQQIAVVNHKGHALVIGAAGTGKTTTLLARAEVLLKQGVAPESIAVLGFSFRSVRLMEQIARAHAGQVFSGVRFDTIKGLASQALEGVEHPNFASNNKVRDVIKRAMIEQGFKGTLSEAEHIIRSFKARSRKPQENEPHFILLQTYKKLLDDMGLIDRHDIVRTHILHMRQGKAAASSVKYILVDNVQDATQIQLVWLQEHMKNGVELLFTANDDVTLFGLDGAAGYDALISLEALDGVKSFTLSDNFRIPKTIHAVISKTARLLKERVQKQDHPVNKVHAKIKTQPFETEAEEHRFLIQDILNLAQHNPRQRIGIVVRHDYLANRFLHACHRAGLRPASYARPIWEKPGAGTVMAMLYLIMGQSSGKRFERFLMIHLGARVGGILIDAGLTPEHFLREKELPESVQLPDDHLRAYHSLRRRVNGYIRLMQSGQADPRDVFKATIADTLPKLSSEEQEDALLAASILLSIKGRLAEILPRLEQETLPDMTSNIVITPVRETRNMEFDTLFMPYFDATVWPPEGKALKVDLEHERRVFHQAVTRTKGDLIVTYNAQDGKKPSVYFGELG